VLDAVECRPTFNASPGLVIGLIAGGHRALTEAVEGAEDREELAVEDLQSVNLSAKDAVCGIASSGRTPYVAAGLRYAKSVGAVAIVVACNDGSAVTKEADLAIVPVVGPEVLTGSTRMKAGTATKLVLNTISTGTMVRLGKTYGNLMVDLRASNAKLKDRARRIIRTITGESDDKIDAALTACGSQLKLAVIVLKRKVSPPAAQVLLDKYRGKLRQALESPLT
jgi:N-acetylmuramic acid 6-phosphate etherase